MVEGELGHEALVWVGGGVGEAEVGEGGEGGEGGVGGEEVGEEEGGGAGFGHYAGGGEGG